MLKIEFLYIWDFLTVWFSVTLWQMQHHYLEGPKFCQANEKSSWQLNRLRKPGFILANKIGRKSPQLFSCANYQSDWFFSSLYKKIRSRLTDVRIKMMCSRVERATLVVVTTARMMMICNPHHSTISQGLELDRQAWYFSFFN